MAKYKAVVKSVKVQTTDKDSKTYPTGTPYINVGWLATHDEQYGQYVIVAEGVDKWLFKRYYVSQVLIGKEGQQKPAIEFTKQNLLRDFNYDGNSENIQSLVGQENEIVTDVNSEGYENVKFVNNSKAKKEVFGKNVDQELFKNIFDGHLPF